MVPFEAFSTDAPQSSSAFCSGCDGGTQCARRNSNVLSCADAMPALIASAMLSATSFTRMKVPSLEAHILIVAVDRTLAAPAARDNRAAIPAAPGIVPVSLVRAALFAYAQPAGSGHDRRQEEDADRSRAAPRAHRLRAAARAARGVPGFLRRLRALRYPTGAIFRADGDRAQSRADAKPSRRGARHQAHELRRDAQRAGAARPRGAAAGARQTLLCALSHDRGRLTDAQAEARAQGARNPHGRESRRGRPRHADRAAARHRGRARARGARQERESFASTSAGIGCDLILETSAGSRPTQTRVSNASTASAPSFLR